MKKLMPKHRAGFTMIELIVALSVLTLIALFAGNIYINYTGAARDLKAANLIYEEGRFVMERLVREVRQNAVDYEEYFNQNALAGGLGENYCLYDQEFYADGFDGQIGTKDDESLGLREGLNPAPIASVIQNDLFLINVAGNERTYITRVEKVVEGETIGKIAMVKLVGQDFGADQIDSTDSYNEIDPHDNDCNPDARENDGLIDTWHLHPDYPGDREVAIDDGGFPECNGFGHSILNDPLDANHSFIDISPNALNVVDLKVMVSPEEDPWKAYRLNDMQIQPYITIQLTVEANPKLVNGLDEDRLPSLTLTSTATTRNYDEVKSRCI